MSFLDTSFLYGPGPAAPPRVRTLTYAPGRVGTTILRLRLIGVRLKAFRSYIS